MRKSRLSEEQNISILKEAEASLSSTERSSSQQVGLLTEAAAALRGSFTQDDNEE